MNRQILVQDAIKIINTKYSYLESIGQLADMLQVSQCHLTREFTKEMKMSPNKYLTAVRIDAAKQILVMRDYKLELVANMVGFSESNYFCKVFRKCQGTTPDRYRMQNAGQSPVKYEYINLAEHEAF